MKQLPSIVKINRRKICWIGGDPKSILAEFPTNFLPIGYRQYHSLFFFCGFENSYALASKLDVIGRKLLILRLTNHDIYSRMLSVRRAPRAFLLSTACFHFSSIKSRQCWEVLTLCLLEVLTLCKSLPKMLSFHPTSWRKIFLGRYSFRAVLDESPETMRRLWLSTKFPHQEIIWNYGILRSRCRW